MSKETKLSLWIVTIGSFFGVLSSTLMSTALPSIMTTFGITASSGQWLTNGYIMVNAIMIPTSAFLMKRFSFRKLYLLFSIIFLLGTIFGAFAQQYVLLIIGRMIQAIGAGVMMPLVNVLAMSEASKKSRGAIMGIIGLAFNFAPVVGPTLSGFILSQFSWRFLFIFVIPFTAINIILAIMYLPGLSKKQEVSFNTLGLILSSFGLLFLLFGLSNIGTTKALSFHVIGAIIIGLIILVIFVFTQTRAHSPFINLKVFRRQQYDVATVINMLLMITMYGNTIIIPLLVQNVMHYSALVSGLVILPGATSTAILSPISGRLYDRFGIKRLVVIGLTIDVIGTTMQSFVTKDTSILTVTFGQFVRQLGLVLVLIPIQTHALSSVPSMMISDAVALFNTLRQVAASVGTAILVGIISVTENLTPGHHLVGELSGIKVGFVVSIGMILLCLVMTIWLKSENSYE